MFYEYKYPIGLQNAPISGDFGDFSWSEGREWATVSPLRGLELGVVGCDPQDLRPGLACVAPTGLLDRGCWGNVSALSWVVFGGWLARSEILRVAQNDKGDRGSD